MSVRTDTINLNVNINGNEAQNKLNDLRKKAGEVTLEMEALTKQSKAYVDKKAELNKVADEMSNIRKKIDETKLAINGLKKGTEEYTVKKNELKQLEDTFSSLKKKVAEVKLEMAALKTGSNEYLAKKTQLREIEAEMSNIKKTIGLTALTQKELYAELKKLNALKGALIPFTDEWKALDKQVKQVENRLYDVKNGVEGFTSFLSKIKDEVKQFGMMALGFLGFEFLTSQFQNIIQGAGKLSDQLADIRRVTGMTADEVNHLNKSLGELETRTSTGGLREIAIIAGKLGVAKEDIYGFVKATDMLVVALGDELGSADQITTQLGKIINVFDKTDGKVTGEKLTHIGNAIVDLANKGVASGGFIVDFTQRLAGLAKTANVGLDETMGLAAGLEELGQKTESSSTAIIKVIGDIGKDIPKFAKIAGKSVEEFSKTMAEKPIEAVLQVSEGLAKGKNSFEEIAKSFDTAGENGARIITTLGVMGGKADFFRRKISDTTLSLIDNNEITDAFTLKNETLGATLDKLSKDFNKLMNSEGITNFLKSAIYELRDFIKFLKELPQWLSDNRTAITATTTIILMYVAAKTKATQAIILNRLATLLETAADKLEAAQKIANTAVTRAYGLAKSVLTGQTSIATAATLAFNLALKQNPLMWVIGLLGLMATAVSFLTAKVKALTREQQLQSDLKTEMIKQVGEEENKSKALYNAIKNGNQSYDAKKKLLDDLIKINPDYLKGLTLENIKTQEGADIMKNYILNLRKVGEEKARQALIDAKLKKKQELSLDIEKIDGNPSDEGTMLGTIKNMGAAIGIGKGTAVNQFVKMTNEMTSLDKDIENLMQQSANALANDIANKTDSTNNAAKQSVRTIKVIKDEISNLENDFITIDIHNTEALKANKDKRKKLQDELDELEGKQHKKSKEESELDKLKKEAAHFEEELKKFRNDVEKYGKSADEKELIDLQEKFKKLTDESLKYFKAHVTTLDQHNKQKLTIEELYNKELQKIFEQRFEKNAEKEYEQSLKLDADYREQEKINAGRAYAEGKLTKEDYEKKLHQIELDATNNRILIAQDYVKTAKKASTDLINFKKAGEKQSVDDAIAESERLKKYKESEGAAKQKLAVLTAPKGSDRRLQAEKDLLMYEFELKTKTWKQESEQYKLAVQERIDAEKALEEKHAKEKIENVMEYIHYFSQALNSLNAMISNKENKMLSDEKKRNDEKKTAYKKQLDSKLISQAVYDKKVQDADEELDRKKKEAAHNQAERERAIKLFSAVISVAEGIAKAIAASPETFGLPFSAFVAAEGALQIGAIANAPLPEMGDGGWIRTGDKHTDASGGINAKIERDEAVMAARTMTDPNQYTVSGTPAQITSALNSINGAKSWASGASLQSMKWLQQKPASINPNIPTILSQGSGSSNAALLDEFKNLREDVKTWNTKIKGEWYIKDLDDTRRMYDASKKASAIKQSTN